MSARNARERHTIAVLVDNEAGVLARVIGLFSGRGYNIESLTVAEVDPQSHTSRITVVTSGTPEVIEQIEAQLGRLVPVHRVVNWTTAAPGVEREMALVKVAGTGEKRVEALAHGRRLPRAPGRHDAYKLRLRNHRRAVEDRLVHRSDAAAGSGRRFAHRRRRDLARPGSDVRTCDIAKKFSTHLASTFYRFLLRETK